MPPQLHQPRTPLRQGCVGDAVIDETPSTYKPIEKVMAAQSDLVEVLHTLKQVVYVKG